MYSLPFRPLATFLVLCTHVLCHCVLITLLDQRQAKNCTAEQSSQISHIPFITCKEPFQFPMLFCFLDFLSPSQYCSCTQLIQQISTDCLLCGGCFSRVREYRHELSRQTLLSRSLTSNGSNTRLV